MEKSVKFNQRMPQKNKVMYILTHKLPVYYGKFENKIYFYAKEEKDFLCKACKSPLKLSNGQFDNDLKGHVFKISGCGCKSKSNKDYFFSVFGANEDLWDKNPNKSRRGINTLDRFISLYGKELGEKRYRSFLKSSRQTLDNMIKRYGEQEGMEKWEVFKRKMRHTLDNYIRWYGEEEGSRRYNENIKSKKTTSMFSFEYWKNLYPEDLKKAKEEHKNYQKRDLLWYIKKYGEKLGKEKYELRRQRQSYLVSHQRYIDEYGEKEGLVLFSNILRKKNLTTSSKYSQSSRASYFFTEFDKSLNKIIPVNSYFLPKNREWYEKHEKNIYFYDYTIPDKKIVIEYNGDVWHMNPAKYKSLNINPITKKYAKDVWSYDRKKIEVLASQGFSVFIVWESEYKQNKEIFMDKLIKEVASAIRTREI